MKKETSHVISTAACFCIATFLTVIMRETFEYWVSIVLVALVANTYVGIGVLRDEVAKNKEE